jgi:hypothetical protein
MQPISHASPHSARKAPPRGCISDRRGAFSGLSRVASSPVASQVLLQDVDLDETLRVKEESVRLLCMRPRGVTRRA